MSRNKLLISFCLLLNTYGCKQASSNSQSIESYSSEATALEKGTVFISMDGEGTACTEKKPCNIKSLDHFYTSLKVKAGDVVFFRGGIYNYSMSNIRRIYLQGGTQEKPITYESFPNERAIFDGINLDLQNQNKKEWREGRFELHGDYIRLRNIEVRNMPQYGIRIFGNHNLIENCIVHNNHLSGIEVLNNKDGYSSKDTGGSYNTIENNIIYNNSDVGLNYGNYNNGGNADGITIHSGIHNRIQYNRIYNNSDDGIDTYKSMHTHVEHNLIYNHGQGVGNANGIKLGGPDPELSVNSIAKHNIVHSNKGFGITVHGNNNNTTIRYNTTYNNKKAGYAILDDTELSYNISYNDQEGEVVWSKGKKQTENSWQFEKDRLHFLTFDSSSPDFLRPTPESNLTHIGAYASEKKVENER
jgi:parallel beta-helix repeat protein